MFPEYVAPTETAADEEAATAADEEADTAAEDSTASEEATTTDE